MFKYLITSVLFVCGTFGFFVSDCNDIQGHSSMLYSVKNLIVEPRFFHTINITLTPCNNTLLIRYMERACDTHRHMFTNFSQTYFPGVGYYLSAFNGVSEISGETYWQLIEHTTGKPHPVGAATYIPKHGDHVAWNLTTLNA